MQLPEWATRKIGPLPTWGWGLVAGGSGLVYFYFKKKKAATEDSASGNAFGGGSGGGTGGGITPPGTQPSASGSGSSPTNLLRTLFTGNKNTQLTDESALGERHFVSSDPIPFQYLPLPAPSIRKSIRDSSGGLRYAV